MAAGFDGVEKRLGDRIDGVIGRVDRFESSMNRRFVGLEQRMMRRFDDRDTRLDDHERRITTLEAQH
ncbi:MAG TPA: hypothetical protein VGC96_11780 [Candidatus Elarobacter sp.]